jgi:hypothetical protein
MSGPDQGATSRPRFPALDPEPPPRPWWWRAVVGAGVLAAVGAAAAAVVLWSLSPGPAGPAGAEPPHLPAAVDHGRIVAVGRGGYLALSDPDGTHVASVRALGSFGYLVAAAPDGRYLSAGNGEILVVRNGATLATYASRVPLSSNYAAAWPYPFADHDRYLVMLQGEGGSVQNPVSVFYLATGAQQSLGVADVAAGDPVAAGAFVSVATPPVASATPSPLFPDSRIELRDAGRPTVVLATAAALNRDLGQDPGVPARLLPYPDPSGDKVAVEVLSSPSGQDGEGIVVLSRAGRVLATSPAPFGVQGIPAWSPSGTSLAYSSTGGTGPALFMWTPGRPAVRITFPSGIRYDWCVWSPDGRSIVCALLGASSPSGTQDWVVADASARVFTTVHGHGRPVAWLPGRGGT